MRLQDPKSRAGVDGYADSHIDVQGTLVAVEDDGTFEHPGITREWAESYAEREGVDVGVVLVDEPAQDETEASKSDTCETVKGDGEVCGRERPCPYHD